jgi:hypothetical protein
VGTHLGKHTGRHVRASAAATMAWERRQTACGRTTARQSTYGWTTATEHVWTRDDGDRARMDAGRRRQRARVPRRRESTQSYALDSARPIREHARRKSPRIPDPHTHPRPRGILWRPQYSLESPHLRKEEVGAHGEAESNQPEDDESVPHTSCTRHSEQSARTAWRRVHCVSCGCAVCRGERCVACV